MVSLKQTTHFRYALINCANCGNYFGELFLKEGIKVHYNSCIEELVDTAWMYLLSMCIISHFQI